MHLFRRAGLGALAVLAFAAPAHAQAPTVVSPDVTHTGTGPTGYTVTFRISDPTATRMRIRGEWFFSSAADTTTTTSAGRLPSQWKPGDFPIANPNNGAAANWPVADMVNTFQLRNEGILRLRCDVHVWSRMSAW